jgi:hypothetical protein
LGLVAVFGLLLSYKWISDNAHNLFWISFVLYFDPGGFFSGISDGKIVWRIKYYDLFFVLMMLSWSFSNLWKREIKSNNTHFRFLVALIAFCSLYFLLATGYVIPNLYGYENLPLFLQKNRQFFYALPVFIAVYQFTYFDFNGLVKPLLLISFASLIAYIITLATGIELLPTLTWSRYGENDRISLLSYGLAYWLLPMGIVVLFLRNSFEGWQRRLILVCMGLMLITIVLTLTRREFIRIFFMLLIIPILINFINGHSVLKGYRKLFFWIVFPASIIWLFFPNYFFFAGQLIVETWSLFTGNTQGAAGDYRVSGEGDLVYVKQIISDHLFFGIGYYPAPWLKVLDMKASGSNLALALDASNEVPIYGSIMRLGIIGLIVPALLHFKMLYFCFQQLNSLKRFGYLLRKDALEFWVTITCVYYVITLFTTDLFSLFLEYYHFPAFTLFTSMIALLSGLGARFQTRLISLKNSMNNA